MTSPMLRRWRWLHRWTSLVCTAFLLLLCLTGLPLIFSDEIDDLVSAAHPVAARANLAPAGPSVPDRLVADARLRYPGWRIRSLYFDPDAPIIRLGLSRGADDPFGMEHMLEYDSHDARLLRNGRAPGSGVMDTVAGLHERLLAGLPGELLLGVIGLLFVLAIVSGVVLYAPFMRRMRYGEIRMRGSRRRRWLDLHNLIGISTAGWMAVVGLTGVMNTLTVPLFGLWVMRDVAPKVASFHAPVAIVPEVTVAAAMATVHVALPDAVVRSVVFPSHLASSPLHYVLWTTGGSRLRQRMMTPVLVDAHDGRLALTGVMPWYLRALEVSRPLHFGDYGGMPLKLLWAVFDLMAIVVLASGLYLLAARRTPAQRQESEAARLVGSEA